MPVPYAELFAGSDEVSTTLVPIGGEDIIPALTPLMLEPVSKTIVAWNGDNSGQASFISPFEIDPSTQNYVQVYKSGTFNMDVINWPESVTTTDQKLTAFVGSALSVQPLQG